MGGRPHWGKSRFGAGWGLGCSEEELVKGSWMVISPLLAWREEGAADSCAGWGTGIISALAQAAVPIG